LQKIAALCAACALLLASEARADTGFYVRGDVGMAVGTQSNESDTNPNAFNASLGTTIIKGGMAASFAGGAGVGFRLTPLFRIEGSYTHIGPQHFKGNFVPGTGVTVSDTHSEIGLINGYFDAAPLLPPLPFGAQPFATVGIGATVNVNGTETDKHSGLPDTFFSGATHVDLAWAVGAGTGFPVANNIIVDVTYRYLDLGERRTGTVNSGSGIPASVLTVDRADLQTHTIMVGARVSF